MAYELEAIVAPIEVASAIGHELNQPVIDLDGSLGLIPWAEHVLDQMGPSDDSAELAGFAYLHSSLIELLARASVEQPVAYFEAMYFGGQGVQAAAVFRDGAMRWHSPAGSEPGVVWPNSPISQGLRQLGVKAAVGQDEFDTVGLGRHRRTDRWVPTPPAPPTPVAPSTPAQATPKQTATSNSASTSSSASSSTSASAPVSSSASSPVSAAERITSLDAIRGVATLGILPMNALSFGLADAAYFNVSAGGIGQPFDWVLGIATMLFVDQKMMALFSLLFGVGVVVFADRAKAKGRRVALLSLWRFTLLLGIGTLHSQLWEGDILIIYAVCAPVVLLVRRLPAKLLITAGVGFSLLGSATAPLFQRTVGADGSGLGELWLVDSGEMSGAVLGWFALNGFGRALGLMLIGVALFRLDIVQGQRDADYYRRMARWGLGVGGLVTALGLVFRVASDWSPDYALTGQIPTGLGTIPMALGYMALLILWNRRGGRHTERFRNVGRVALTNYLTQTILGVAMLTWLLGDFELTRTMIAAWILCVWALQLWWSTWWLDRFRYGPFEWAWRCATYRTLQPLRRAA